MCLSRGVTQGEPGTQERGTMSFFWNTLLGNTEIREIAGDMNTQVMTFRLNKDTGSTEDL